MPSKFWRDRNAACWRRTAAWQKQLSRTAAKPGLRLYHAGRADHAARMAALWALPERQQETP